MNDTPLGKLKGLQYVGVGDMALRLVTYTDLVMVERLHKNQVGYFPCHTKPCVRCHDEKAVTYFALSAFALGAGEVNVLIPETGLPDDAYEAIASAVHPHRLGSVFLAGTQAFPEPIETLARRLEQKDLLEVARLAALWSAKRPCGTKRIRLRTALEGRLNQVASRPLIEWDTLDE